MTERRVDDFPQGWSIGAVVAVVATATVTTWTFLRDRFGRGPSKVHFDAQIDELRNDLHELNETVNKLLVQIEGTTQRHDAEIRHLTDRVVNLEAARRRT